MGIINDRYKAQVEASVLLNSNPEVDYEVVDNRVVIQPQSYTKPQICEAEKETILAELADDLKHYGLNISHLDAKLLRVSAGDFILDVPKQLVIPYDDAIFGSILKYQQQHFHKQRFYKKR